jgi:PAS domain S-box-containing protein
MNTVLFVDADSERRIEMGRVLEGMGYQVMAARDGVEALGIAARVSPGIAICSWPMVGSEGKTLAAVWRKEANLKDVPLVAYTPRASEAQAFLILSLGFDAWVDKMAEIPGALSRIRGRRLGNEPGAARLAAGTKSALDSLAANIALLCLDETMLYVHDGEGRLLDVNNRACTSLGYTREELLAFSVADLEVDFDPAAARREWSKVQAGQPISLHRRQKRKDGTTISVDLRLGCFEVGKGRLYLGLARDVSEQLQRISELQERERHLNMAVDAGKVGLWDWDLITNRVWYSLEWKRQIGFEDHEITGSVEEWRSRVHAEDLDRAYATLNGYVEGISPRYENEFRFLHKNGTYRWILARGALISDAVGKPIRILGAHVDITEHKLVEQALSRGEARYRQLFDSNPQPMWVYDTVTLRFLAVNDAAIAHYGYSRMEFLSMNILDIRPEREVPRLLEKLSRTQNGLNQAGIWIHRKKDGALIEVEITAHSVMFGQRSTELVLANDVTQRRQAERRVHQLNRIYAVLSEINKLIFREREVEVILMDACRIVVERGGFLMAWIGKVDEVSQKVRPLASAGESLGYLEWLDINVSDPGKRTGPVGRTILSGKHEISNNLETDVGFLPWRGLALAKGYRSAAAFPLGRGGSERPFGVICLYAGVTDYFDAEETQLLDGLAADISFALEVCEREEQRKRVERAMRESDERFHQLTESIEDVFWMTDPSKQQVIYVSPAYEKIWGRSLKDLYAAPMHWLAAVHEEDRVRVAEAAVSRQVDGRYDEEYRIVRPDGQVRWIRDRAFPVTGPNHEVLRVVGVARDVTSLRELEDQLRQSQKLEAIGQLAGGVAHDFNNILAAILMQAELAELTEGLPDDVAESLAEIRLSAERAASLTRQLLLFGRRQVLQPRTVDLNEIVGNLARMLQRIIGEDVRLQLGLDDQPLFAHVDPGMLDQVLLNLAVNSRDAMPGGGRLLIETDRVEVTEEIVRKNPDAVSGTCVRLSVSDTGQGIPPEVLPRIFEPFFTTKLPGKGSGLGLATVFGIVKQHRGWIHVDTTPGRGTRFEVYLRMSMDAPVPLVLEPATTPRRGKGETILLVEDDYALRLSTRAVLERQGYRVMEAANGVDAEDVWLKNRQFISLLLTDLVMPGGVSGQELARRLQQKSPQLKAIFTSGYSAEIAGRELKMREGEHFLQKPFPPEQLLEKLRDCLD